MATNPTGAAVNAGLTQYAFGIFQDFNAILADADFLAPRVITGAGVGEFSKFDEKQAFLVYDAGRAIGGTRTRIKFAGEVGTFDCKAKALEIGIDDQERLRAGDNQTALEQAKIRTLLSTFALSRFSRAYTKAVTSGNYTAASAADSGSWSNANIDPIAKIDAAIAQIHTLTGLVPNRLSIDLSSWIKLRNHPKVMARQPGAVNIGITLAQLVGMLAVPLECRLVAGSAGTTGFGSSTTTKASIQSATVLVFFAQPTASQYDPSALKTFTPNSQSFAAVRQYRDDTCSSDMFYIDVEEDIASISASLIVKIAVT